MAAAAALPAFAAGSQPDWFDRPMRWAQLVFVEDDPGRFDINFWLDYFKRTHADGVCLGGGGYMAYYPTRVPFHHRSRWLGDSDPFGDMVKACRDLNMVVIARTDPHATYQDVRDAHPDWIAVDEHGNPRRHWAKSDLWVTCALGPYNFEFMTAVTREITERYQVDGIFSNRWAGSGMCYCRHCRENFKKASGLDLPRGNEIHPIDTRDRARREYTLWRQKRLFELWDVWDRAIRKANPNARYIANSGGGALSSLDMKSIGERAPILFADRQARSGTMPIWANGKNGKEYRAAMGRKPIGGIFSVGVEESYRWKDSVQSPEEIKAWVIDGIANGLRPWYAKFNAKVIDKRWLRPVEEVYDWHWRNEKYLRNVEPLARVAIVYSQQTAWFYGGEDARRKVEDHTLGYYQALVEARIPFEMAHDGLLDAARLSSFRTVVLPNIAALSTQQCAQLRDFVQRGGGLVATYETSLYDERGERRPDFGLADLFGASYTGTVQPRMQNSYLTLEGPHPLVAGLEDAPRIVNSAGRVHVRTVRKPAAVPLTLVPSYPDLPMEDVFPRVAKTDEPQVYLQEFGQGRVVYFPGDLDRTYWEVLQRDHGRILRNAVLWAANEEQPATVSGPGMLDVTLWQQAQSLTLHLVNLTNPMAMRGSYREVIPVCPQRVRIRVPEGVKPGAAKLLVSGRAMSPRFRNGILEMEIPSIDLHEVVAVDFA